MALFKISKRRVALASCDPYPPVEDDEGPLRDALERRGFEVVSPAWDAAYDWSTCVAVLLRTTWDYHVRCAEFLAWCERVATITRLFHGPDIVRWNVDKRYLRALAERGVPIAETRWLDADASIDDLRLPYERAFLKPVVGANASDTLRFACDDAGYAAAIAHIRQHPQAFMLQPYLASVERDGELSIIAIEGQVAHAIRKVPAPGDYRVQEDWGARDLAWHPDEPALALAHRAIEVASDILGQRLLYGRVDMLVGPDGYVLNELELVEPALFLRHGPRTGDLLAAALEARIRSS